MLDSCPISTVIISSLGLSNFTKWRIYLAKKNEKYSATDRKVKQVDHLIHCCLVGIQLGDRKRKKKTRRRKKEQSIGTNFQIE